MVPKILLSLQQKKDEEEPREVREKRLELMAKVNDRRCEAIPMYGVDFHMNAKIFTPTRPNNWSSGRNHCLNALYGLEAESTSDCLTSLLFTPEARINQLSEIFDR